MIEPAERLGRPYYQLLGAFVISMTGDWIFRLAMPVLLFEITGSALWMAVGYAASFAPYVLVMPFGGVIGDMVRRQRLLVVGDGASGAVCVALAAYVLLSPTPSPSVIVALLFALASIESCYHPAFQGFVPSVTPSRCLARANSLFAASENTLRVLGPIVGGVVIAALGTRTIVIANAATFIFSVALIASIRPLAPEVRRVATYSVKAVLGGLAEGVRVAASHPIIKWGTVLFILVNFASHIVLGNLIFFLTEPLGVDVRTAGLVIGGSGLGAVAGALIAPWFVDRFLAGRLMLFCVGLAAAGTALLFLAPDYGVGAVVAGRGLAAASEAMIVVAMFTLRQRAIPQSYLSRTVAITRAVSYLPVPVAAVVGGAILARTGGDMTVVIALSVASLCLCVAIGLFTPFVRRESHRPVSVAEGKPVREAG